MLSLQINTLCFSAVPAVEKGLTEPLSLGGCSFCISLNQSWFMVPFQNNVRLRKVRTADEEDLDICFAASIFYCLVELSWNFSIMQNPQTPLHPSSKPPLTGYWLPLVHDDVCPDVTKPSLSVLPGFTLPHGTLAANLRSSSLNVFKSLSSIRLFSMSCLGSTITKWIRYTQRHNHVIQTVFMCVYSIHITCHYLT